MSKKTLPNGDDDRDANVDVDADERVSIDLDPEEALRVLLRPAPKKRGEKK